MEPNVPPAEEEESFEPNSSEVNDGDDEDEPT